MKPGTYRFLTVQVEPDPDALRTEEVRGEKYLVAPVVAVAEGVLNGGFLPFEEIALSAPGWNGVPVTVNHPEDENGDFVPANLPNVLEAYQIGRFLNAKAEGDGRKLAGELWIHLASVKWMTENVDGRGDLAKKAVEMIKDGDPLEVSTGYWHGVQEEAGEFEGQQFDEVQVDLLPDHLAVLPESEGACNWDGDSTTSGCGAPRTQVDQTPATNAGAGAGLAFAANCGDANCDGDCDGGCDAANASPATRLDALLAAIGLGGAQNTDPTATVSYAQNRANPTANDDPNMGITDDDDRLEAIANASTFEVEELREMDDQAVEKIEESLKNNDGGDGGDDPTDDPADDPAGSANDGGDDVPEWAQNLNNRFDQLEARLDAQEDDRRAELVDAITANSNFEEDELPESVEKLEAMAEKLNAQTATTPNYGGRAAGTNGADDVEGYEMHSTVNELTGGQGGDD
jgi:hypothetical protein